MIWVKQTAVLHASSQSYLKYNEYSLEERAKMGRYGTENGLAKAAMILSSAFGWQAA